MLGKTYLGLKALRPAEMMPADRNEIHYAERTVFLGLRRRRGVTDHSRRMS